MAEICLRYEMIREKGMEPRSLELKVVPSFSNSKIELFNKPIDTIYPISYSMIQNNFYIH